LVKILVKRRSARRPPSRLLWREARLYSHADIAELYGFRWNSELDLRAIKSFLHLAHVRCKSPEMVRRELRTTLLAYNLIRTAAANAAAFARQATATDQFHGNLSIRPLRVAVDLLRRLDRRSAPRTLFAPSDAHCRL
jgi:IS4 transposase